MIRTALIVSLVLFSAPAAAAPDAAEHPSITVPYADLDLSRSEDQQRLDRRIRRATERLCPSAPLELTAALEMRRCRRLAAARAEAQVHAAGVAVGGERAPVRIAAKPGDKRS